MGASLIFVCKATMYTPKPTFFNDKFTTYLRMRNIVCKTTKCTPQPTFFNDLFTTFFPMRMTLLCAHMIVPGTTTIPLYYLFGATNIVKICDKENCGYNRYRTT